MDRVAWQPSLEDLSLVFESVSDAITLVAAGPDEGFRFLSANPAALTIMENSAEGVVGRDVLELLGSAGRDHWYYRACMDASREHRTVRVVEEGKPGTTIDVTLKPIVRDGRCTHILTVTRDVTADRAALDAIRASEQRLDATLRSIRDAVITLEPDGRISHLNARAAAFIGRPAVDVIGRPFDDVIHLTNEETGEPVVCTLAEAQHAAIELPVTLLGCEGGPPRFVAVSGGPIAGANGTSEGAVLVLRDVTAERAAAVEKRRIDEERAGLSAIIEGSQDFIALSSFDEAGLSIDYINPAGRALVGLDPRGPPSKLRLEDIFPADKMATMDAAVSPILARDGVYVGESLLQHTQTGEIIPVEVSTFVVRNPNTGQPSGLASIRRDIRERKRVEERLRESEARYRVQFEHAPEAICTFDVDTQRFVEANDHMVKLFGYSREELTQLNPGMLSPPEQPDGSSSSEVAPQNIERALAGEQRVFEWIHRDRHGRDFPCEIRLVRLPGSGNLCRGSIVEITDRKQAEELKRLSAALLEENRLIQTSNRVKSEFVANMSHELRTPLNAILGFAELLYDGKVGSLSDDQRGCLVDMLASGKHLLSLINGMLDLAKVESGRMEFSPELIRLGPLCGEVVDVVRSLAARKRVRLGCEVEELGTLSLDPARLKQVLFNLLSNAIKFTSEGGRVDVRVRSAGPAQCRIEVEDTGIGIREQDLSRLFVEFTQLDSGSTKHFEGTGLGLVLTRRIVESMGGSVGIRSDFGKGSVFSVLLPRVQASGAPRPPRGEHGVAVG